MKNMYLRILSVIIAIFFAGNGYAQTQLITDGGFEAGPLSGNWIESSTNFTTPVCDIVNCGSGFGTGPRTGTHFAWFGGFSGGIETGTVSQSITIPLGTTVTLSFWLEQSICDSQQDFLRVTVDGNVEFTTDGISPLCNQIGYVLQTINLSAYADGNAHVLEFNSSTFSANGGRTDFFVDDISVISTVAGGNACADTTFFTSLNLPIPDDDANGVVNTQTINGVPGNLGVDVQLKGVCFKIDHTWVGDLIVNLVSPSGLVVNLTDRMGFPATAGGCDGDNLDVCIVEGTGNDMEAICSNLPAAAGIFTANGSNDLSTFNSGGGTANGIWQLVVSDNNVDDTGAIIEWSLIFDDGPVAQWISPDTLCASAGVINLSTLVTGTAGGTWSGTGVTGTDFNPIGLSGPVNITYSVSNVGATCTDTQTNTIYIVPGAPVAGFTFSTLSLTTIFTNISVDGTSYLWNFGDTNTSSDENPIHTYSANGIYSVTLTAINACGITSSTQSVTVTGCPDVVTGGSFEAGPGSGDWTETSTNFNTPICDLVNCGTGGGSGPRTGTYWSHFGGVAQFEESSVSQTVSIPINTTATLYFWLELPVCDGPDDFLKIAVDADTVYSINGSNNNCGDQGYFLQSVSMSAYNDGLPHTLKFISKVYGNNGGITSFFVDDINLYACTGIGFAENDLNSHVTVMPVPATDFITVKFSDITSSNVTIELYDLPGKNIMKSFLPRVVDGYSEKLDVSGINSGIYLMKITSGKNTAVKKIVIR